MKDVFSEQHVWHAKLPSVWKRHMFSFLMHRVAVMCAEVWGDSFVSLCLTMIVLLSFTLHRCAMC